MESKNTIGYRKIKKFPQNISKKPISPRTKSQIQASEEEFQFYSSLNSNKMKKFIRSKIDHNDTAKHSSPNVVPDSHPPLNVGKPEKVKPEVQPPLPLDPPPPPDKPLNLNITLKKEIEDMEYQCTGEESSIILKEEIMSDGYKPSKPMCRDFIRGKCTRPGTCKFSHKHDTSQLVGVYTFCRNFQNSVCTLPNCKYVHATVFEEQHFYRTAQLPPHALAHHKKVNIVPPPPPPTKETYTDVPTHFSHPPPPLPVSDEKPTPVISCVSASKQESRTFLEDLRTPLSTASSSTLKHELANLDFFGCSPRDHVNRQKCKNCDFMEFRLQYNKERVEKMKQSSKDLRNEINHLNQKNEKLHAILHALWKNCGGRIPIQESV